MAVPWAVGAPAGHAELTGRIEAIHARSHGTYGMPRVRADLAAEGTMVSRKRVARLMREAGLEGTSRRRGFRTTRRDETARPAQDLVERDFTAGGPDRLWVADVTYIPTWSGFLFLAVVMDAWFEILDALEARGLIAQTRRAKSLYLTEQGLQRAQELEKRLASLSK